ncbi:MAG: hypothetical protein EOP06_00135 [Proteobacteria bacterium]|nr:MAG: hypothetical protein EOP06_00135 [Pseudomonadota bacterium]
MKAQIVKETNMEYALRASDCLDRTAMVTAMDLKDGSGEDVFSFNELLPLDRQPYFTLFAFDRSEIRIVDYDEQFIIAEKHDWLDLFDAVRFAAACE